MFFLQFFLLNTNFFLFFHLILFIFSLQNKINNIYDDHDNVVDVVDDNVDGYKEKDEDEEKEEEYEDENENENGDEKEEKKDEEKEEEEEYEDENGDEKEEEEEDDEEEDEEDDEEEDEEEDEDENEDEDEDEDECQDENEDENEDEVECQDENEDENEDECEDEDEIKKQQEVKYIPKMNDFKFNKLIFNQINNLCYFFAYLEIYYKNVKNLFYFFKNNILKNQNKKNINYNVYFINNGSITLNIKIENENDFKNIKYKEIEETLNYDIIILNKNKNCFTFYDIEELKNVNLNDKEEEVKYSFINIELSHKEKIYDIKLKKKDEYNYLFNKNKINKYFFYYFLKNNCNLNEIFNEDYKYNIELIDNNINVLNMNEKQELILCNNDYIIQ